MINTIKPYLKHIYDNGFYILVSLLSILIIYLIYWECVKMNHHRLHPTKFYKLRENRNLKINYYDDSYNISYDYKNKEFKKGAIFVSCASYRDDQCTKTLDLLFKNAKNPDNIFVGICQQNSDYSAISSEYCLSRLNSMRYDQITMFNMPEYEARGPTFARYICSHLWNGEEYYLQIDSHCYFEKNWDQSLIDEYNMAIDMNGNDNVVISAYPHDMHDHQYDSMSNNICNINFLMDDEGYGVPSHFSMMENRTPKNMKKQLIALSQGCVFAKSKFLLDVPFDPYLPNLFNGEEFLFSARMWTSGWNFYNISKKICSHHYTRDEKPKYWNDNQKTDKKKKHYIHVKKISNQRVKHLIGLNNEIKSLNKKDQANCLTHIDKYGLGSVRTISDYYDFVGLTIREGEIDKDNIKDRCELIYNNNSKKWE